MSPEPPPGAQTTPSGTPAGWYADPMGRHEYRWWDGSQWTSTVSDAGTTSTEEVVNLQGGLDNVTPQRVQAQVAAGGWSGAGIDPSLVPAGGGTVFTEPVLVVNQKAKLIEVTNQYAVFDRNGTQIAYVSQVGQSTAKKVLRVLTSLDQFMTHRLEVRDMGHNLLLGLTRPAKVMKSTVVVTDPQGMEIGRIVQANMIGKIRFDLVYNGSVVGRIQAENWRAWNFRIEDHTGTEVARITKTFEGLARTLFTSADNYVVQLHTQLAAPLLPLVVASALSVDTALKQDSRGLG